MDTKFLIAVLKLPITYNFKIKRYSTTVGFFNALSGSI